MGSLWRSGMLSAAFLPLAACVLVPALALQLPVGSSHPWEDKNQVIFGATVEDPTEWGLDNPPNPNDTDHLVFETVHSLLQHWPNTRIRNGKRRLCLFDLIEHMVSSRP